jgi:hypothetical protein
MFVPLPIQFFFSFDNEPKSEIEKQSDPSMTGKKH